jgi:hypothetical protein
MKNRFFNRILSLVLVLASLVSSFAIFSFAEGETTGNETAKSGEIELLYYRNYEEGWDFDNGFAAITALQDQKVSVDYEETENGDYNYFMRFEGSRVASAAYLDFDFGTSIAKEEQFGTVFEMRIKADDYAKNFGDIFTYISGSGSSHNLLYIQGDKLMCNKADPVEIGVVGDKWLNVAIAFDWTTEKRTMTVYYGELDEATRTYQYQYTSTEDYTSSAQKGAKNCRFIIPAITSATLGSGYCVDDVRIYNGSSVPVVLTPSEDNPAGSKVNVLAPKPITILGNANDKSAEQILADALCMKVGVNYALVRNERQPIFEGGKYGGPVKIDGEVRISLDLLLDYIGFPYLIHPDEASYDITTGTTATYVTVGRTVATVAGERVILNSAPGYVTAQSGEKYLTIGISDIEKLFPGWAVTYDEMGLILIYEEIISSETGEKVDIVNRHDDLGAMLSIMKKFIFGVNLDNNVKEDYINSGKEIYDDVKEHTTQKDGDNETSFNHPYLVADQKTFNTLKEKYASGTDLTLKGYIQQIIDKANAIYSDVAKVEGGKYIGIKNGKAPMNKYNDAIDLEDDPNDADTQDGYSPLGRVDELVGFTENLIPLAFAYQVTGNEKYALLAYDYMSVIAAWEHWGHGYFMDCAQATSNFALAYDWLYNAFEANGRDTKLLSDAIYNNAIHHGVVSSMGNNMEGTRFVGDESEYITRTDYWNPVGASGMLIGALAIMDRSEYVDDVCYLIGNNLSGLCLIGLDVYAPDGAYIESPLNWCYSTNALFTLVMALDSAAGNTYGFANTWGLDKTCYYALQIESSDGFIWNYNDGGFDGISGPLAGMETQIFNYVGKMFSDNALIYVRSQQLLSGKKDVSVYDLIFYPFDGIEETPNLPLTYYMSGLEAYVVRSGWEDGALYTGIMGGPNNCDYGNIDSGNFIYHNKGVVWFMDLGSEDTAVYDYYGTSRNKYYRVNPEGQNVLFFTNATDVYKYGQSETASGIIQSIYENEHGSYAILDNFSAYESLVTSAKRGLFVTNGGKTVVIQDELNFKLVRNCEWVAHTAQDISISEDGKTAYLSSRDEDGKVIILRASLVTPTTDLVFSIKTAYKHTLSQTYGPKDSVSNGGASEYDRTPIKKLVIYCNNAIAFDAAVVFEVVGSMNSTDPVGYEWQTMAKWEPYAEGSNAGSGEEKRGTPKKSDIRLTVTKVDIMINTGHVFNDTLDDFYKSLTLLGYTFAKFSIADDESLTSLYTDYLDFSDVYQEYADYVDEYITTNRTLSERLSGLYVPETEDAPIE